MFRKKLWVIVTVAVMLVAAGLAFTAFAATGVEKYIPDAEKATKGMTLWDMILAGGVMMIFIGFLSVLGLGLVIYYFILMKDERLMPKKFFDNILPFVEKGLYDDARKACAREDNYLAVIFLAGLNNIGREKIIIKEAIQDAGRRCSDGLWQRLSYLGDIATIAPLAGLLGTVLGMMQAFNVIAFDVGAVKPILLASGIAKAMVNTASGLAVAIPALVFYSFFRGKIQTIIMRLEGVSTEIEELLNGKK